MTGRWGARPAGGSVTPSWVGPDDITATILAAARTEFARRGYEATTIRDIAGVTGVGMASLYRRVESKETLLRTIVDVYADGLNEVFEAVMASKGPDSERLYAIMRVFAHASRHFREESRIVVFGWYGRESAASPVHDYFVATQRRLDALTGLFGRGLEDGTVRPDRLPAELAVTCARCSGCASTSMPAPANHARSSSSGQSRPSGALARP